MCLRVSESSNQWFLFICSFWKWHLMTTSVILSTSLLTVLLAHMVAINWRNQFKEAKGKGNLSAHSKLLNQKERMWSCEASWTGSPPTASEALGLHRWWRTTANKLGSISEFFQPVYLSTVLSINLSVCLYGKKLCALNFFRCGDRIHPHTASEAHHTVYTGLLSKTFWKKKKSIDTSMPYWVSLYGLILARNTWWLWNWLWHILQSDPLSYFMQGRGVVVTDTIKIIHVNIGH